MDYWFDFGRGGGSPLHFLYLSTIMYATPNTDTTFDKYDEMRLHMKQLLSASILDIDMPMRIAIPLDNVGIRKLKDLVKLSRKEVLGIKRLGKKAVDEIETILGRFDLCLGMKTE